VLRELEDDYVCMNDVIVTPTKARKSVPKKSYVKCEPRMQVIVTNKTAIFDYLYAISGRRITFVGETYGIWLR
jgi:hypothetical protein